MTKKQNTYATVLIFALLFDIIFNEQVHKNGRKCFMPKILEDMRGRLLNEAKKELSELGYGKMTVRSVASACGIAIGTLYNYFPSKDMLIATFMLEDWNAALGKISSRTENAVDSRAVISAICDELEFFIKAHADLFSDKDAELVFSTAFADKHPLLRAQLSEYILPICNTTIGDAHFVADFIAEAILTWMIAGKSYKELAPIFERLLQ